MDTLSSHLQHTVPKINAYQHLGIVCIQIEKSLPNSINTSRLH